jgi:putative membrane protein
MFKFNGERGSSRRGLTGKAKELVTGVMGRVAARTAGGLSSTAFIRNAAIGDMYEIEAARLALTRAQSPRVQEIAQQMIDDHTTSTHQLQSALRMNETRGETSPPASVDARRHAMLDSLREAADDEFDRAYLDQQVLAHKETVELMTSYRDKGKNAQLRSFAAGTAPVVTRHLRHMEALRDELPG